MQQRPLFKPKRRPTRLVRHAFLVGFGVTALFTAMWQILPGEDTNTAQSPLEGSGSQEIPLPLSVNISSAFGENRPNHSGHVITPARQKNSEQAPTALPVSLESRPNFHIPGHQEALEAIQTPDENLVAVDGLGTAQDPLDEHMVTVRSGDTLSTIFEKAGLGYSDVLRVLDLGDDAKQLERLQPGETLVLMKDNTDQFAGLKYDLDAESELNIFRHNGDQLIAEITELPSETRLVSAGGTIRGSLYQSAIATGVPPAQIMQLAEVFGWKIDFLRDVRDGDQFRLIYEVRERDGERLSTGHVMAAEYVNRGKRFRAVRYTSPDGTTGYYEPDGSSLERGFLRYPIEFSRISSNFNLKRLHPIHNTVRPHYGVDLAAPTGTPIKSAASGRVTFVGWKHGYGKVVQIRHDEKYDTVYAHMSGFKGNLKRGASVGKGSVIGYVGMTGDATGPHLHYEIRVNGKRLDPLKVDLPEANPIASNDRQDFLAQTRQSLEQLAAIQVDVEGEQPVHLAHNVHNTAATSNE